MRGCSPRDIVQQGRCPSLGAGGLSMGYAFFAMIGWCGTKWPGWWRGPRPPQPDPWWWIVGLAGAVGGIVSATVFAPIIGEAGFFGGGVTAFAGGILVGSIV